MVLKGFGRKPLMVLTTKPPRPNRNVLWRTAAADLARWVIEETRGSTKRTSPLEDVRARSYERIKAITAAASVVSVRE